MKKIKLNTLTLELHDSMSIPAVAENFFHFYLINQSGTGSTIEDVRRHYSGAILRLQTEDLAGAVIELENADYTLQNMAMNFNPLHCAWACLIANIDGEPLKNYDHDYLQGIVQQCSDDGLTATILNESLEDVKKNWKPNSNTSFLSIAKSWIDNPSPEWNVDVNTSLHLPNASLTRKT
ncbi:hypothetical protein [Runella sp.]|uniref:hypothetical protein n=1 Tax=Runella sp. TaxID=1960881 RepID=UPI003D0EAAB1